MLIFLNVAFLTWAKLPLPITLSILYLDLILCTNSSYFPYLYMSTELLESEQEEQDSVCLSNISFLI